MTGKNPTPISSVLHRFLGIHEVGIDSSYTSKERGHPFIMSAERGSEQSECSWTRVSRMWTSTKTINEVKIS